MQRIERGNTGRAFRMDDRRQQLMIDRPLADSERFFGWQVADAEVLQALTVPPEQACVAGRQQPELADQRFVREPIRSADPAGSRRQDRHQVHGFVCVDGASVNHGCEFLGYGQAGIARTV
jgi:hypothetical protein